MTALSWKQWAAILVGGVAVGLAISFILPHDTTVFHHAYRRGPGAPTAPAAPSSLSLLGYLPWILVFAGVVLGTLNRNNTAFLTFAGTIVTAGVTLLTRTA